MFKVTFRSAFNTDNGPWDPWSPFLEDRDWGEDKLTADFKLVQDLLLQLNACKSIGSD